MAQIVTITTPLTGQPAQVDQLEHTAQEIDDAIARALPGGAIDMALQNKAPANIAAYSDINITVSDGESIQAAVNTVPKNMNGKTVFIHIYGTHNESTINISGYHGGYLSLRLHEATINGTIELYDDQYVDVIGDGSSTINGGSDYAIHTSSGTMAYIASLNLTTSHSIAILAGYLSHIIVIACQILASGSGNYCGAMTASDGSSIDSSEVTIRSGTLVGLAATGSSRIWFNGTNNANTAYVLHHSKIETI